VNASDWLKRPWRDLRSQMLVWIVFPAAAVILILSFSGIYSHQMAMRALVEERDLALAVVTARSIEEGLDRCRTSLEILRDDERLSQWEAQDYPRLLQEYAPHLDPFERGVALATVDGELLAAWPDSEPWVDRIEHLEPLLQQASARQASPLLVTMDDPQSGQPTPAWIVPGAGQSGVLIGAFPAENCGAQETLAGLTVGSQGEIYLADDSGTILYPPGLDHLESDALAHLLADGTHLASASAHVHQDVGREPVVMAHAPLSQGGWMVIVQEPWSDLLAPLMRYSQLTPLVVLLIALGALVTLALGVRQVLRPLEELRRRANRIAWGDFSAARDPVGGVAEIDELRATLNQLAERVRAYQTGMQSYAAAVTQAQEEERLRLGHELHDDTVQSLVVLAQDLDRAQKNLPANAEGLHESLTRMREITYSIIDHLRRYVSDLRPVYLEDLGLIPALEKLVDDLALSQNIDAQFNVAGEATRLNPDVELAIFRIVQEALKNAEQYAHASLVRVRMQFESGELTVVVEDDGVGFEAPEAPRELTESGHYGLIGMQERALLIGGSLHIGSQRGEGTRIVFSLPFQGA
jgi:signal transduction histidine kinase